MVRPSLRPTAPWQNHPAGLAYVYASDRRPIGRSRPLAGFNAILQVDIRTRARVNDAYLRAGAGPEKPRRASRRQL